MDPIKIFKGNDTDFNGGKFLTFTVTSDIDLTDFTGIFTLGSFSKPGSLADGKMEVVIPAAVTSQFPLGCMNGSFQLVDTKMRVATVTNTIPFVITSEVFTQEPDTIALETPEGYPVELTMEVGFASGNYNDLNNLPTLNGVKIAGDKTAEDYGLATVQALQSTNQAVAQNTQNIATNTAAIAAETSARELGATTLQNNIDAEAQTRAGADTQLQTAIANEVERAQVEEADLQGQIDALSAAQNVHAIVGTYAELQAYDTTSLPPNEIVKVLVDSTHNNAATYYNWTGSAWEYIGSEGPYATPAEVAAAAQQATDDANSYTDNKVAVLATQEALTAETNARIAADSALENAKLDKTEAADAYVANTQKNAINGVAGLDANTQISPSVIPYAGQTTKGGIKQYYDEETATWYIVTEA